MINGLQLGRSMVSKEEVLFNKRGEKLKLLYLRRVQGERSACVIFSFPSSARAGSQGLVDARQAVYHRATPPAQG